MIFLLAVTYRTVPSNVHPGIVLFWLDNKTGFVEFFSKFDGGDSKSGFCRRSVNENGILLPHVTENKKRFLSLIMIIHFPSVVLG